MHDKTTDFTIEGWVYANSVSPHTTLFTTNGGTSAMWDALAIIYPDGGIYFETYRGVNEPVEFTTEVVIKLYLSSQHGIMW